MTDHWQRAAIDRARRSKWRVETSHTIQTHEVEEERNRKWLDQIAAVARYGPAVEPFEEVLPEVEA